MSRTRSISLIAALWLALPLGAQGLLVRGSGGGGGGPTPTPTHTWLINEGSGQTVADSIGSKNCELGSTAGADGDDPTWVTGGLDFTNDFVDCGSLQPDFIATAHTLCAVVEYDTTSGFAGILGEWDSPGWFIAGGASGQTVEVGIRNTSGSNELRFATSGTRSAATVYHICMSLPASPTYASTTVYVNGATAAKGSASSDTLSTNPDYTGTELRMGSLQASVSSDHKIYLMHWWTGDALDATEVENRCNADKITLSGSVTVTCP